MTTNASVSGAQEGGMSQDREPDEATIERATIAACQNYHGMGCTETKCAMGRCEWPERYRIRAALAAIGGAGRMIDHDELVAILMMAQDAGADPEYVLKNQRSIVAQVRAGAVHDGDCTKQAHTCLRCLVEDYDEVARAAAPFITRALVTSEKAIK